MVNKKDIQKALDKALKPSPFENFKALMQMITPEDLNQLITERLQYQGDTDFFVNYVAPKYHFDRTCNILYRMRLIMNKAQDMGMPYQSFEDNFINALEFNLRNLWTDNIQIVSMDTSDGKLIEIPRRDDYPKELRSDTDENGDVIYY